MWKVCAEPTTSAGVGLWNSNSDEERPTSPVTPNPAAAAHSLFLILLFSSVHHLRMLSSKQRRRRQGGRRGLLVVGGQLNLGRQSKSLALEGIKAVNHTGLS